MSIRQSAFLSFCLAGSVAALTGCDRAGRPDRDALRLYEGAPPVIPHLVEQWGRYDCLVCHRDGNAAGAGRTAPIAPHPEQTNCRQCHVARTTTATFRDSTFSALRLPGVFPPRANPIGPPHVPHRLQDRGNCASCHLPKTVAGGSQGPVPRHGMRSNCTQCHVPQDFKAQSFPSNAPLIRAGQK